MRELLWKEYRERRLWAIPLLASVVGVVALGKGYTYCGEFGTFGNWIAFAALAGLLFGMSEFSGELAWGTPDFLFSRPVSWKKLVAAKLVFGLGLIAAVAILGAIVFRFATPEPYRRFATIADLAPGTGWAFLIMAIPYVLGTACSALFPGAVGAVLMLVAVGAAFFGEWVILADRPEFKENLPLVTALGWALGLILATLLVVRFGLTLSIANRVKRFVLIMIPVIVVATVADSSIHRGALQNPAKLMSRSVSVNPDSRYAVERIQTRKFDPVYKDYDAYKCVMLRVSDMKRVVVASADLSEQTVSQYRKAYYAHDGLWDASIRWAPGGKAYYLSGEHADYGMNTKRHSARYVVTSFTMTNSGRIARGRVYGDWRKEYVRYLVPSPSGRLAAVVVDDYPHGERIEVVDVERGRKLPFSVGIRGKKVPVGNTWGVLRGTFWWQSDTEIGYLENNEKRRIVRVTD